MRAAAPLFVALVLALSTRDVAAAPRLGVALLRSDGSCCVTFRGEVRGSGDRVLLVLFAPPRVVDGVVRRVESSPCSQASSGDGEAYSVQVRHRIGDIEEVGIAVYAPGSRAEYLDGQFVVHTRGAKTPLQFRLCTSQEGLHLTTWRGNRRTWHEYWYLGYDVEPNCTDEEVQE